MPVGRPAVQVQADPVGVVEDQEPAVASITGERAMPGDAGRQETDPRAVIAQLVTYEHGLLERAGSETLSMPSG